MKQFYRSIRAITAAIFFLILTGNTIMPVRDALGRAGRGESYRSSGSSSSSSSNSGSSSRDREPSSGHLNPSWRSTPAGSSGSSVPEKIYRAEYDINYDINSYYAVLKVNSNGTVNVTETFDVTINKEQQGIARPMFKSQMYNALAVSDAACPQGYASYSNDPSGRCFFELGYKDRKVTGRHVFTLSYNAIGMVLPHGSGARVQWRSAIGKEANMESIRLVLPGGPSAARAFIVPVKGVTAHAVEEIPCSTAGNQVTVPVNRRVSSTLDITAYLPQGAIDPAALRAEPEKILKENKRYPALAEYRTRVTIHDDRTIGREDSYRYAPDSPRLNMRMEDLKIILTQYISDRDRKAPPVLVHNKLFLYGFRKEPCEGDNYMFDQVCIPAPDNGQKETNLRYSMWGSFNPGEPFFFELRLPPSEVKLTDRIHFEIDFPPFVKKEQVKTKLYLYSGFFEGGNLMHETGFESRWEGSKLIGDYNDGLYDEQYLKAQIFLPSEGFKSGSGPGMTVYLSHHWYFNRWIFIGVIAAIMLLAGGGSWLFWFMKKKKASAGA